MNLYILLGASVVFTILLGFGGVQTYRLSQSEHQLELIKTGAAQQSLHDLKNKERTDAQYKIDVARARSSGMRNARHTYIIPAPTRSGDDIACYDTGELNTELTRWAGRVAERLSRVAQQAEEAVAAYQACRAWALEGQ